jgi:hypothetical protein
MKRPEWTLFAAALCAIGIQLILTHGSATASATRPRPELSQWTRIAAPAPVTEELTGHADLAQLRAEARVAALRRDIYHPGTDR